MEKVKEKHEGIKDLISSISSLSEKVTQNQIVFFKPISVNVRYHTAEVCFGDLINWLYILFREVSTPNLVFFTKKLKLNNIDIAESAMKIDITVHVIRTVTSHNMDPFSQSDQEKRNFCDDWYMTAIAKKYPENEVEWERCTHRLLDDAKVYLDAILQCIITVSASEHFDVVLKEWINLVKRDFGVYDFEVVLKEALINHGLEGIFDTNKIVKLEIDKWRDELKVLKDGFDFHVESYKIVEKFIQRKELCPISGRDLIEIGVPKGEFLGDALKLAKEIFYQDPCKNEILLQRVKKALKYVI